MSVEVFAAATAIISALVGGVIYVVRLEGTTRVLKAEIESLGKLVAGIEAKVDLVLAAVARRSQITSRPRVRRQPAGRGRAPRSIR